MARRTFFGGAGAGGGGAAGPATVEVFPDAAARDAALPDPAEGSLAYVGDWLQVYADGAWPVVPLDIGDTIGPVEVCQSYEVTFGDQADEKRDLYFEGPFYGSIEVTITSHWDQANATGVITALYAVGVNATGDFDDNTMTVLAAQGPITDHFALMPCAWDADNSWYKITVAHRTGDTNRVGLAVRVVGVRDIYAQQYLTSSGVGDVYTSDATVADVNVVPTATLASPTFTGTPAAPTAAPGTNTTQVATTAFVTASNLAQSAGWRVRGEWSAAVTDYAVGDVVQYLGVIYVNKVPSGPPTQMFAPSDPTERTFETTKGAWDSMAHFAVPLRDTAQFHSGVASLKLTQASNEGYGYIKNNGFTVTLVAGTSYIYTAWVRCSKKSRVTLGLTPIGGQMDYLSIAARDTWVQLQYTFTAAASGSTSLYVQESYEVETHFFGESWWLDDLSFVAAAGFNPADWDVLVPAPEIPSSFLLMGA